MKKFTIFLMFVLTGIVCYGQNLVEKYMNNPEEAFYDARISFNEGDYRMAVSLIKVYSALSEKKDGEDILFKAQKCQQYEEQAHFAEKQGDVYAAVQYYHNILSVNPNDKNARNAVDAVASGKGYMDIKRVLFVNKDKEGKILTDSGVLFYKEDIRYIAPQIYYNGLSAEKKSVELYFKIFGPDGTLKTGNGSPSGYTWSDSKAVFPGNSNMLAASGWGNADGGAYSAGTYRFEVWCNGNELFATTFEIKSRPQISVSNSTPPSYSPSRTSSSSNDFFLFRKPERTFPDIGILLGFGKLTTVGLEFNGNVKSFFFGLDAALNTGEYKSETTGVEYKGGAFFTGSLGYRTQYWGVSYCCGNQWASSMVDGKETMQSVGIVHGPKLAIYPIPDGGHIGIAIYLSYMIVPGLSEFNGFKFGLGLRM